MATIISAILLFSFFPSSSFSALIHDQWSLATATYTRTPFQAGGGACGYSLEADDRPEWMSALGRNTAALSGELFRRGEVCGSCFELRCVDHILFCLRGSPSVTVTAVDFCAPNYGLPSVDGGWCNFPRHHFDLSLPAFASIARSAADIVPVQYRRVRCNQSGKMRFTVRGSSFFYEVLITNVGFDGVVAEVKVKGRRSGWIPMGRNWGQNWHCNADLSGQPLSFEVTGSSGRRVTSYNIAPPNWRFGQTFEGEQFEGTRNSFLPELPALTRVEIASKLWKKKDKSQNQQRRNIQNGSLNGENSTSLPQFCVRLNTLHHIQTELQNLEKKITNCIKDLESSPQNITNPPENKFELTLSSSLEGIQQLCETTAYKVVFFDLSHVLWNFLYVKDPSSSRIDSFLKELDPKLETISTTVHNRVRNRVITALMKASFDGFLLVLLAGGPSRAYTRHDSQILEEDFKALKDLFFADGDGLPLELVEKAATQVQNILPLFRAETESLIVRFKQVIIETYGSSAKSRYPMPPTLGHWSPAEANTILRVLCYRNDDAASKFLKKTYNLPKKL